MDDFKRAFHEKNKNLRWTGGCYCCSLSPKERKAERKRIRRKLKYFDRLEDVA